MIPQATAAQQERIDDDLWGHLRPWEGEKKSRPANQEKAAIFRAIAGGALNHEIAERFGITERRARGFRYERARLLERSVRR